MKTNFKILWQKKWYILTLMLIIPILILTFVHHSNHKTVMGYDETFKVGIIENENFNEDVYLRLVMQSAQESMQNGVRPTFNVVPYESVKEASKALEENEIIGYINLGERNVRKYLTQLQEYQNDEREIVDADIYPERNITFTIKHHSFETNLIENILTNLSRVEKMEYNTLIDGMYEKIIERNDPEKGDEYDNLPKAMTSDFYTFLIQKESIIREYPSEILAKQIIDILNSWIGPTDQPVSNEVITAKPAHGNSQKDDEKDNNKDGKNNDNNDNDNENNENIESNKKEFDARKKDLKSENKIGTQKEITTQTPELTEQQKKEIAEQEEKARIEQEEIQKEQERLEKEMEDVSSEPMDLTETDEMVEIQNTIVNETSKIRFGLKTDYVYGVFASIIFMSGILSVYIANRTLSKNLGSSRQVLLSGTSGIKIYWNAFIPLVIVTTAINLLIFIYLKFVLKVMFYKTTILPLVLAVVFASILVVHLGMYISILFKNSNKLPVYIYIVLGIIFAVIAGVFNKGLGIYVTTNFTILNRVNPIYLISNIFSNLIQFEFMGINLDTVSYFVLLVIMSILLHLINIDRLRRRGHEE